jgi:hypothetical protein
LAGFFVKKALSRVMLRNIIVLLILIGLVYFCIKNKEGFSQFPVAHTAYVDEAARKYSSLTNLINLTNPVVDLTTTNLESAIATVGAKPSGNRYELQPTIPVKTLHDVPGTLKLAKSCEAAPNNCSAFDNPTFAANCGMSFDVNGTASNGTSFKGGLYLSPDDRAQQVTSAENVQQNGTDPYDPYKVYQPTIGTAARGTFGITKDSCIVVKEKVDCEAKQTFGSPNCTQCYTSQRFARVGPETGRLPSKLYLVGNGVIIVYNSVTKNLDGPITLDKTALSSTPTVINIPANSEGKGFIIQVLFNKTPVHIAGYIEGSTPAGTFKLDLLTLTSVDQYTGKKPRITGTVAVNGFKCKTLSPGSGQTNMAVACMIPFSFINMYDGDALTCNNGPIITKEESATFLESDPCYGKANAPGAYKLECLQSRWMEMGGTEQGTGYPSTKAKADAIQRNSDGTPRNLDDIIDTISALMSRAMTGKDASGGDLTIPDWNNASMYAMGIPISTPCDGPGGVPPISQRCLEYTFKNQGVSSYIGATYTLPSTYASKKEGFVGETGNIYIPSSNGPLSPSTPAGLAFGQSQGSLQNVKNAYDMIVRTAFDNTQVNTARSLQLQQVLDATIKSKTAEGDDFDVRIPVNQSTKTYDQLKAVCESKGKRLCQSTEICDMQKREVTNPSLTATFPVDNWIAVGDKPNEWLTLWNHGNRYCKTHSEVTQSEDGNAYLPTWGSQTNPAGWERLVKCCDGPATMLGRYIRLEYDRRECLNLAHIAVYPNKRTDSNLITPNTIVTKSSGHEGDIFPSKNFVVGNSFVHTSCYDVPWIEVDMGATVNMYRIVVTNRKDCCQFRVIGTRLVILDDKRNRIYTSDQINTSASSYTWFPPTTEVYNDVKLGDGPKKRQTCYGNNGSVSCDRYCRGIGGGPWNGELPRSWNGAQCAGYDSDIGGCYTTFRRSGAGCVCEETGTGWS